MAVATAPHHETVIAASMLDPKLQHQLWHDGSVAKVKQPPQRWMPLSFLAGLYLGIGTFAYTTMTSDPDQRTPLARGAAGIGFSIGLTMIMMTGAELYTGSCMELMAVLNGTVSPLEMAMDLSRKWTGNFIGCIFFAATVVGMGFFGYPSTSLTPYGEYFCSIAIAKANLNWWEIFFRALLAAFLICVGVLMCVGSRSPTGKMLSIAYPVTVGGVLGFEHCIANMFMFSAATMINCNVSNHGWYWLNLLLSTFGNLVGGWIIAFMYYHGYISGIVPNVPPPPTNGNTTTAGSNEPAASEALGGDDMRPAGMIAVEMIAKSPRSPRTLG